MFSLGALIDTDLQSVTPRIRVPVQVCLLARFTLFKLYSDVLSFLKVSFNLLISLS